MLNLAQFTGSDYVIPYLGSLITPGIEYLADNAGCWWFIDIIAIQSNFWHHDFCLWTLEVDGEGVGVVTAREDSDLEPFYTQRITYTEYSDVNPLKIYQCGKTILLPSEY